ncbi:MAG TPA: tRNA-dihydrouridine synthase family protein [Patescibacteria group bacterium]|nr:tRNA-dihydrouridine synthase family protein [Patescibacteria group bacterium]
MKGKLQFEKPSLKIKDPLFRVRNIPVYGDVVLAPMAGFSDVPHRELCRQFGSAMNYSEFVAAEEIVNNSKTAMSLLDFVSDDKPMVFQIFGNDPQIILRAAQQIEPLGPDIIDINMGCSTRRVSGRGAGVGMMLNPQMITETFRLLTKHLQIPITGKIRLGWDRRRNYLEVARILEDNGAALIAIHPRTKEQKYSGPAEWRAIYEIKNMVSIPVLGNGDVRTVADVDRMKEITGCDAVMIGRGAIGNPWLFARIDNNHLLWKEYAFTIRIHLQKMQHFYGDRGLILFRKYVKRYLEGMASFSELEQQLLTTTTYADFFQALAESLARYGRITVGSLRSSVLES